MSRSLWFRVLLGSAASVVLVQGIAGVTIYLLVRGRLYAEFDASLAGRVRALAALVEQEGGEVEAEFDERRMVEFAASPEPEYLQVCLAEGQVLYRSSSLGSDQLERMEGRLHSPAFRSLTLPDGRPGRTAAVRFIPRQKHAIFGPPQQVDLAYARATTDVVRTLARVRLLLIAVCTGAAFLSVVLLDWIVSRGVRPVSQLAAQIAGIRNVGLSARVALDRAPTELVPVVERLNALLAELDAAFRREKAFTANVAHELRTPLTGLRTTLDLSLSKPRQKADYQAALGKCHRICSQMCVMVDNLLSLARADAGQIAISPQTVDLARAVRDAWLSLAPQAEERGLTVEWDLDPSCSVRTDPELLRLILLNVLGNAVVYADAGGTVRIACSLTDGQASITVTNSGSTLTDEQAQQVFDRFWRGDPARSSAGVHCGLGLALCKTLMSLLGGRIAVSSAPGGEFTVALTFHEGDGTGGHGPGGRGEW